VPSSPGRRVSELDCSVDMSRGNRSADGGIGHAVQGLIVTFEEDRLSSTSNVEKGDPDSRNRAGTGQRAAVIGEGEGGEIA
jgi:hypothetical protein